MYTLNKKYTTGNQKSREKKIVRTKTYINKIKLELYSNLKDKFS